jgi:hypothetical protein
MSVKFPEIHSALSHETRIFIDKAMRSLRSKRPSVYYFGSSQYKSELQTYCHEQEENNKITYQ